jgi:lactoylglutathione lyase
LLATQPESGQFDWAMMKRNEVEMMLQARASLTGELPLFKDKAIGGSLTFYIDIEDVEGLYANLKGKVTIVQDMHSTFYGAQEFAIQDGNGYILTFAEFSTEG